MEMIVMQSQSRVSGFRLFMQLCVKIRIMLRFYTHEKFITKNSEYQNYIF